MIPPSCKRLAEVNFPIAEISRHAAREKSIRYGHPSTLHLWWARRPLASSRDVLPPERVRSQFAAQRSPCGHRQRLAGPGESYCVLRFLVDGCVAGSLTEWLRNAGRGILEVEDLESVVILSSQASNRLMSVIHAKAGIRESYRPYSRLFTAMLDSRF